MSPEQTVTLFRILALVVMLAIPLAAWRLRGRGYAAFVTVILVFSVPPSVIVQARLVGVAGEPIGSWIGIALLWALAAAGLHLVSLLRARLRSRPFRLFVSLPGQLLIAAGMLSCPWLLLLGLVSLLGWAVGFEGADPVLAWLGVVPFIVAGISTFTSRNNRFETVRIALGEDGPPRVARVAVKRIVGEAAPAPGDGSRVLRIVQITDPHLGPWQSVRALREEVRRLVEHQPDLVLMTGDFLTMEGMGTPGALAEALSPLRELPGRCFAIFGNHDHEAPDEVRSAIAASGTTLLIDEEARVETSAGWVQLVGSDYHRRERKNQLLGLLERFPRRRDHLRILLLHDPLGFRDVPPGEVDLTLSGHTHGGQVGLVSFGLDWTVLSGTRWPDHGLFAHGSNRLYVHRGTGFYGFPLRIGVPGERSVLELLVPERDPMGQQRPTRP